MTVPLVAAPSASCSAKATLAPRPATRSGASAARVAAGTGPRGDTAPRATPAPLPATTLITAAPTPTDAVDIAAHRRGRPDSARLDNVATAVLMLHAIERLASVRETSRDA